MAEDQRPGRSDALQCRSLPECPIQDALGVGNVVLDISPIRLSISLECCCQLLALVAVVQELDSLFKADGDDQANEDGGNVNQEILPRMDGLVGSVRIKHRRC